MPWDTLFTVRGAVHRDPGDHRAGAAQDAARAGARRRTESTLARIQPLSLTALLATLVLLFGFQGEAILRQPLVIAMLAVPILIQVFFNSGLAYLLNRRLGVAHCVAGPSRTHRREQLLRAGGGRGHQPLRL